MKKIDALNIKYPSIFNYDELKYVYNFYCDHNNQFFKLNPLSFYEVFYYNQKIPFEYFFIGAFYKIIEYNVNDITKVYVFLSLLHTNKNDLLYISEQDINKHYQFIELDNPKSKYYVLYENLNIRNKNPMFDCIKLSIKNNNKFKFN